MSPLAYSAQTLTALLLPVRNRLESLDRDLSTILNLDEDGAEAGGGLELLAGFALGASLTDTTSRLGRDISSRLAQYSRTCQNHIARMDAERRQVLGQFVRELLANLEHRREPGGKLDQAGARSAGRTGARPLFPRILWFLCRPTTNEGGTSMPKIAVVTDSSAFLPESLVREYGIHVIPLNVTFNGTTYKDLVDLSVDEFYKKLAAAAELPSTSQPSAGEFVEVFKAAAKDHDGVIAVVLSSSLSGTYSSAMAAKEMLPEIPIAVVDTRSVTMGTGLHGAGRGEGSARRQGPAGDRGRTGAHGAQDARLVPAGHPEIPGQGRAHRRRGGPPGLRACHQASACR